MNHQFSQIACYYSIIKQNSLNQCRKGLTTLIYRKRAYKYLYIQQLFIKILYQTYHPLRKMLSGCRHSYMLGRMKKRQTNQESFDNSFACDIKFTQETLNSKYSLIKASLQPKHNSFFMTDENQPKQSEQPKSPQNLQYQLIKNFDMFGPDLQSIWAPNRQKAIAKAIEIIKSDPGKCVVLAYSMDEVMLYVKDKMKCDPSDARLHQDRDTIMFRMNEGLAQNNQQQEY